MVEFRILRGRSRVINRIKTLELRRANFALFTELLGGISWARALEGRGVQDCWSLFKCHFLHAQERCIPLRKKWSKGSRRPARLNKELLAEIRWKRKVHGMWKEGQVTWEEYRNVVRACSDATRKAKAHLEIKLARDVKNNKKGFFNYISSKRKARDNVGPLLNEAGVLATEDAEKAELLIEVERFIQRLEQDIRGKGDSPAHSQGSNGPPCFLDSFSERSLGAAGSRLSLRLHRLTSKGYVQQQFQVCSQVKRDKITGIYQKFITH